RQGGAEDPGNRQGAWHPDRREPTPGARPVRGGGRGRGSEAGVLQGGGRGRGGGGGRGSDAGVLQGGGRGHQLYLQAEATAAVTTCKSVPGYGYDGTRGDGGRCSCTALAEQASCRSS